MYTYKSVTFSVCHEYIMRGISVRVFGVEHVTEVNTHLHLCKHTFTASGEFPNNVMFDTTTTVSGKSVSFKLSTVWCKHSHKNNKPFLSSKNFIFLLNWLSQSKPVINTVSYTSVLCPFCLRSQITPISRN